MDIKITTPDESQLTASAEKQLNLARAYKITTPALYAAAADDLKSIKSKLTELDTQRKSITKPLDEAKAAVMNLFRPAIDFLQQAESTIKGSMLAFDEEQERLRQEEERRLRAAQEEERQRIQQAAERAAREAREAEAAAASAQSPDEKQAAESRLAEATALVDTVQSQQSAISVAPTPVVSVSSPKVSGIARKSTWRGECFDLQALVKAVAEGKAPITLLELNTTALNQMAKAMKETLSIPGCRAVEEKGIASSRR